METMAVLPAPGILLVRPKSEMPFRADAGEDFCRHDSAEEVKVQNHVPRAKQCWLATLKPELVITIASLVHYRQGQR